MLSLSSNLRCPSCQEVLTPKVLSCDRCELKVEGPFRLNEFATLSPEDLHFLRVFVRAEGRIKEMEGALGLSYPTIRTRLTEFKKRLFSDVDQARENPVEPSQENLSTAEILERLQSGKCSFDEAMRLIRQNRSEKTQP